MTVKLHSAFVHEPDRKQKQKKQEAVYFSFVLLSGDRHSCGRQSFCYGLQYNFSFFMIGLHDGKCFSIQSLVLCAFEGFMINWISIVQSCNTSGTFDGK